MYVVPVHVNFQLASRSSTLPQTRMTMSQIYIILFFLLIPQSPLHEQQQAPGSHGQAPSHSEIVPLAAHVLYLHFRRDGSVHASLYPLQLNRFMTNFNAGRIVDGTDIGREVDLMDTVRYLACRLEPFWSNPLTFKVY